MNTRYSTLSACLLMSAAGTALAAPIISRVEPTTPGATVVLTYGGLVTNAGTLAASERSTSGESLLRWTMSGGSSSAANPVDSSGIPWRHVQAHGISADGLVVVGTVRQTSFDGTSGAGAPFRWTLAGGYPMVPFPAQASTIRGVDASGDVAIGYFMSAGNDAVGGFRWNGISYSLLGPGPAPSGLHDVNAPGTAAAGFQSNPGLPFLSPIVWSSTGVTTLPMLPDSRGAMGTAISADGAIVAGVNDTLANGSRPMRWVSGVLSELPLPAGANSGGAFDMSDDGQTVVGFAGTGGFVWTAVAGTTEARQFFLNSGVDVSAWASITDVRAVSPDGLVFTGYGRTVSDPDQLSVYVVTIPAPWSGPATFLALGVLGLRRRARA